MEPREQLGHLVPTITAVVDRIDPDQLTRPTPCGDLTVHDVLDHLIVVAGSFADRFRGEDATPSLPPPVYGRVPAAEFRKALDDLLDAVGSPGAMERMITTPTGDRSGRTVARGVALGALVHGWDLASATGQRFSLSPAVVESIAAFGCTAITPEMRTGPTFANPTAAPAGASRLDRLLAWAGRAV